MNSETANRPPRLRVKDVSLRRDPVRWPHDPPRLADLGEGLTVIYGPNGAGKSTLRNAIARMLWGEAPGGTSDDAGELLRWQRGDEGDTAYPTGKTRIAGGETSVRHHVLDLQALLRAATARDDAFRKSLRATVGLVEPPAGKPIVRIDARDLDAPRREYDKAVGDGERAQGVIDEIARLHRERSELPRTDTAGAEAAALDRLADAREAFAAAGIGHLPDDLPARFAPGDPARLESAERTLAQAEGDLAEARDGLAHADRELAQAGGPLVQPLTDVPGLDAAIGAWKSAAERYAEYDRIAKEKEAVRDRIGADPLVRGGAATASVEGRIDDLFRAVAEISALAEAERAVPTVEVPAITERPVATTFRPSEPAARPTFVVPAEGPSLLPFAIAACGLGGALAAIGAGIGSPALIWVGAGLAIGGGGGFFFWGGRRGGAAAGAAAETFAREIEAWTAKDTERRRADAEAEIEQRTADAATLARWEAEDTIRRDRESLMKGFRLSKEEIIAKTALRLAERKRHEDELAQAGLELGTDPRPATLLVDLQARIAEYRRADIDARDARGKADAARTTSEGEAARVRRMAEGLGPEFATAESAAALLDALTAARTRHRLAIARDGAAAMVATREERRAVAERSLDDLYRERGLEPGDRRAYLDGATRHAAWAQAKMAYDHAARELVAAEAAFPVPPENSPEILRSTAQSLRQGSAENDRRREDLTRKITLAEKERDTILAPGAFERATGDLLTAADRWFSDRDAKLVDAAERQLANELNALLLERDQPAAARHAARYLERLPGELSVRASVEGFEALQNGRPVPFDALSDGTRSQILLAAQLGTVEALDREVRAPILVDEALAMSDAGRAEAVMQILLDAAEVRQVLVFTNSLDEVARWRDQAGQGLRPIAVIKLGPSVEIPDSAVAAEVAAAPKRPVDPWTPVAEWDFRNFVWEYGDEEKATAIVNKGWLSVGRIANDSATHGEIAIRVAARAAAAETARHAWRVGRARVPSLEWLKAIDWRGRAAKTDSITAFYMEMTAAKSAASALRTITGMGEDKQAALRDALRDGGFLPDEPPLSREAVRELLAHRHPEVDPDRILDLFRF